MREDIEMHWRDNHVQVIGCVGFVQLRLATANQSSLNQTSQSLDGKAEHGRLQLLHPSDDIYHSHCGIEAISGDEASRDLDQHVLNLAPQGGVHCSRHVPGMLS